MKTKIGLSIFLALFSFFLTSCHQKNVENNEIKIGVIAPLTGEAESFGKSMKNGIELLVDSLNNNGGINNKKVKVIFEDDKLSSKDGVNAFNKLVNIDKVECIIGSASSSISLALLPKDNENKVVMISSISTADALKGKADDFFFRVVPPNYKQGVTAAKFVTNDLKKTRVAILSANDDYGISFTASFENALKDLGINVILKESYNAGTKDFKNQLLKIKNSNPEAVLLAGIIPETALILKQASELKLNIAFISGDGSYSPDLVKIAGKAANGTYYTMMSLPNDTVKIFKEFKKHYTNKFGYEPDIWAAYSYDAALALTSAIKNADLYQGEAIKEALFKLNIQGVTGNLLFDDYGEIKRDYSVFIVENGEFHLRKN